MNKRQQKRILTTRTIAIALAAIFAGSIFAWATVLVTAQPTLATDNFLPIVLHQPTPTPFPTPVLPPTTAEALVQITPNGAINASTFNPKSFIIHNLNTHSLKLEKVTIDLSTSIFPDMVFDPNGAAGDSLAGDLDVDSSGSTGYSGRSYSGARGGGYDVIELTFNQFEPGRTFKFSVDVDPNSIRGVGAPGPAESGSVSGLELMGTTISAEFENGVVLTQQTYHVSGSGGGSEAILREGLPTRPTLGLVGQPTLPTTVSTQSQVIQVNGPPHYPVRLFQAEGGLFLSGVPNGGFDLAAYDANSILAFTSYEATLGANGSVQIPVNLIDSHPNGGLNYFMAVVDNFYGTDGLNSTPLVVELSP